MHHSVKSRFALNYDAKRYRRFIAGMEVIIHCHHYNARMQRVIEGARGVDGKRIIVESAEAVFAEQLRRAMHPEDDLPTRWTVASELFAHLGFGQLDFTTASEGQVTSRESHIVEGWRAAHASAQNPVCSLAVGFVRAAVAVVTELPVWVRESECMLLGAERCRFEIDRSRTEPLLRYDRGEIADQSDQPPATSVRSPTVDEAKIVRALVEMPIVGNHQGLIPAFNVFLANMPGDFYNLVSIRFVEEMARAKLEDVGRGLLMEAGEACAMNTFRGILASAEWDALIQPMVKTPDDRLFGLIAVSNALGWGNWHVVEYQPGQALRMVSHNSYESSGHLSLRGQAQNPVCLMLSGVTAGVMELLHGQGSVAERLGQFSASERACRATGSACCDFRAEAPL